jgi:hypothetical protein
MALAAVAALLVLPSAAQAAAKKPTVATKSASNVAPTTVQLNGAVNPQGAQTTYFFQIGTTVIYGSLSPETPVGNGTKAVQVSAAVAGLAPATTYHYRIVARNSKGLTRGKDRTFKTKRQPLGLVLNAAANPVKWNSSTTLSGQLTGTGNAGQQVVLQANPFPYSAGFVNTGNALVTGADGSFAFPLIGLQNSTQYRVVMPEKTTVVSPIVSLGVKLGVTTHVSTRHPFSRTRVRFSGRITPIADGQQILIQKFVGGQWTVVSETVARHSTATSSKYSRRVKIRHSGTYRVLINPVGIAQVANVGREIKIKVRRH